MTRPAMVAEPVSLMVNQGMVKNIIEPAMMLATEASCSLMNCFN